MWLRGFRALTSGQQWRNSDCPQYCTFGNCKLVFFRTCVDRYGGALVVLGMSENPGKPSFRSPNGLLAPFLA